MAIFSTKEEKGGTRSASKKIAHTTRLPDGTAHDVIRAPWLSEKALVGTEKGVYVFAITSRATSAQVAGAVKEIYGVAPRAVRIVNTPGKTKALRNRRGTGTRAARRKAY